MSTGVPDRIKATFIVANEWTTFDWHTFFDVVMDEFRDRTFGVYEIEYFPYEIQCVTIAGYEEGILGLCRVWGIRIDLKTESVSINNLRSWGNGRLGAFYNQF